MEGTEKEKPTSQQEGGGGSKEGRKLKITEQKTLKLQVWNNRSAMTITAEVDNCDKFKGLL